MEFYEDPDEEEMLTQSLMDQLDKDTAIKIIDESGDAQVQQETHRSEVDLLILGFRALLLDGMPKFILKGIYLERIAQTKRKLSEAVLKALR